MPHDLLVEPRRRDHREVVRRAGGHGAERGCVDEAEGVRDRTTGDAVVIAVHLASVQRHPQADPLFGFMGRVVFVQQAEQMAGEGLDKWCLRGRGRENDEDPVPTVFMMAAGPVHT